MARCSFQKPLARVGGGFECVHVATTLPLQVPRDDEGVHADVRADIGKDVARAKFALDPFA